MKRKTLKRILIIICLLICILLISNKQLASYLFGEVQYRNVNIDPGNIEVPHNRTIQWNNQSLFADSVINMWADRSVPDSILEGKGNAPRILLAKLMAKQDIPHVNSTIMKLKAWGISGSSWRFNKKGDYDFTITVLTTILWFYGDQPELLYPETKNYLLNVLLTEKGNRSRYTAPRSLGLVKETENHLLMTEGSRYLKNRWIMQHGNKNSYYNNVENGMETRLIDLLKEMNSAGLYEFNSLPYTGYTITALLNLEAFASSEVRIEARNVLDYLNWCYALGSYQYKHFPPMRRRYEKASFSELTTDYHSVFMKTWLSYYPKEKYSSMTFTATEHSLIGACMPYRPADSVPKLIFDKGNGYFLKLGHGPDACPEIYSAGKKFLLSAGGVNRGKRSLIIVRPITLFLNDTAEDLSGSIQLSGNGTDFMKWNNTGVYKNFACAAGPVFVPDNFIPVTKKDNWSIFSLNDSVTAAVYSTESLGLLALFDGSCPDSLLNEILKVNPNQEELSQSFKFPDGPKISYDVKAPRNKWVIISENDILLDRDFDHWPLIEGVFYN
jgi:hypothetical protein